MQASWGLIHTRTGLALGFASAARRPCGIQTDSYEGPSAALLLQVTSVHDVRDVVTVEHEGILPSLTTSEQHVIETTTVILGASGVAQHAVEASLTEEQEEQDEQKEQAQVLAWMHAS